MSRQSSRPPAWLWLLAALLVVNLVVLGGVMLRSGADATPPAAATPAAARFEDQVERASREVRPADNERPVALPPAQSEASPPSPSNAPEQALTAPPVLPDNRPRDTDLAAPGDFDGLPDIDQLRASGDLPVGQLRLDIHVYSDVPADRFVFINMVKHREGSSTSDGLTVDTITPDGVVLDYRGRTFLLPRQ